MANPRTAVYPLFMNQKSRGRMSVTSSHSACRNTRELQIVGRIFNMEARDYKRFLNFLRKHDCPGSIQRLSVKRGRCRLTFR
jgi:hypothetical protein